MLLILINGNTLFASAIINFENNEDIKNWTAGSGSTIELNSQRYKSGEKCLKWKWTDSGAPLTFKDIETFKKLSWKNNRNTGSCLAFWLYNETPRKQKLTVTALEDKTVFRKRTFNLNYKGWRIMCMPYRIAPGQRPSIDTIRFEAPLQQESGELYLDLVNFNILPAKMPPADYQQPWLGNPQILEKQDFFYSREDAAINRPWLPPFPETVTDKNRAEMQLLAERFLPPVMKGGNGVDEKSVLKLKQRISDWKILEKDGIISGVPIDRIFLNRPADAINISDYIKLCGDVSRAYSRAQEGSRLQDELKKMFVLLCKHYLDQGWQEGMQPNWLGGGYDLRHWPPQFYGMRDVLDEAGIADEMGLSLAWFFARGNLALEQNPEATMDIINNHNKNLIPSILMLSDERLRLHRLRIVKRYFDTVLTNNTMLKPDGTAFHHGMHHFAYASYSMPRIILHIAPNLSGTEFNLSQKSLERLKTYIWSNTFACNKYDMPPNLNGRAGTPIKSNLAGLAKTLAVQNTIDGKQVIDRDLAGLYLKLVEDPDDETVRKFAEAGIQPAVQSGHISFNGAVSALHRRNQWLAVMTGMVKFYRGLEIYGWTESNNYGIYARNGSIFILSRGNPVNLKDSGFSLEGWDWCRWPGTTAPLRPQQELFNGYTMRGSQSTIGGGTELNDNGIWGEYHIGTDVSFKKSAFFFDNRITIITTDISRGNSHPVTTTIYQMHLDNTNDTTIIDGNDIKDFPDSRNLSCLHQSHWLMDNKQNGYFIFPGQSALLEVKRQHQQWTYMVKNRLKDQANSPIIDIRHVRYKEKPLAPTKNILNLARVISV